MAKAVAMTDEQRAERRRQEQQLTEQAVAQLRCSTGWQRWLTARSKVGLRRLSLILPGRQCRQRSGSGDERRRHVAASGLGRG